MTDITYVGSDAALPSPGFQAALDEASMVVFCPSNPCLSVFPILSIPGVRESLVAAGQRALRVAVSPIVGGDAVRGPAGKIMAELGHEVSSVGVARAYRGIVDVLFIDEQDAELSPGFASWDWSPSWPLSSCTTKRIKYGWPSASST